MPFFNTIIQFTHLQHIFHTVHPSTKKWSDNPPLLRSTLSNLTVMPGSLDYLIRTHVDTDTDMMDMEHCRFGIGYSKCTSKAKSSMARSPSSGESTSTVRGVKYQLLAAVLLMVDCIGVQVCGAVVDWCASRLAKLICSRTILMASSPGSLLICHSLATGLRVLPPLPSGRVRSGVSC